MLSEAPYRDAAWVSVRDGRICCFRGGAGPALLLVHGIPLSMLTWRENLAGLCRFFRVIAVDLKGFGRSEKTLCDLSPEGHARTLSEVLDQLGIDRVSVVGSSYGCAPAICLALREPERVERLVLINSVGAGGRRHSLERLVRIGLVGSLVKATLRQPGLGARIFATRLRRSYADPARATEELLESYLKLLRTDGGESTFLETLRRFDEPALARRLPEVRQPALILWGDQDRVLPLKDGLRLREQLPACQLHVLAGCGHLPHEERPEEVNELIRAFLAGAGAQTETSRGAFARREM